MARFGMPEVGSEAGVRVASRRSSSARLTTFSQQGGESVSGQRVTGCCVASHTRIPVSFQRRLGSVAHFGEPFFELVDEAIYGALIPDPCLPSCSYAILLARLPATAQIR
jgi:hypothetical protein